MVVIKNNLCQLMLLGPLLLLVYINGLHCAINYCKKHVFADGINLKNFQTTVKVINKQIHLDLKNLSKWLNANKVSHSMSQATELKLFNPPNSS